MPIRTVHSRPIRSSNPTLTPPIWSGWCDESTRQIAWTLTQRAPTGELSTLTTLAHVDGTNPRVLLEDVPVKAFGRYR
ncbi:MAG UNVERIFIED_CONTAM: hypothetical protein LVT10_13935 [Anaerolineae bacterium]